MIKRRSGQTHTGCPKKRGISECCNVCFTAHLILSLEYSCLIHWKREIHMIVPSTEPFLINIREPRSERSIIGFMSLIHLYIRLLIILYYWVYFNRMLIFLKIHFSCHFYFDIVEINILSYQQFKNPKLLYVSWAEIAFIIFVLIEDNGDLANICCRIGYLKE